MSNNSKQSGRLLLVTIIGGLLVAGAVLIGLSVALQAQFKAPTALLFLDMARELGQAFIIASIVAIIFERFLVRHRTRDFVRMVASFQVIEAAGLHSVFPNRQQVFDRLFKSDLPAARQQIKIIGICVSLFKEAERGSRAANHFEDGILRDLIARALERNCKIKVLVLRRYPQEEELNRRYGVDRGDLYVMRERDEESDVTYMGGARLKKIANDGICKWIEIYVWLAERHTKKFEIRQKVLQNLQIREYLALPAVSLYIVDDRIYVTPYLYKRHCSDIPSFEVVGREKPLYGDYEDHFDVTWTDQNTRPAVPPRFVELLIESPDQTVRAYREIRDRKRREINEMISNDPAYATNPESARAEELAIVELLRNPQLAGDQ